MPSRVRNDDQGTMSNREAMAMTETEELGSWETTFELGTVAFPTKWKIITCTYLGSLPGCACWGVHVTFVVCTHCMPTKSQFRTLSIIFYIYFTYYYWKSSYFMLYIATERAFFFKQTFLVKPISSWVEKLKKVGININGNLINSIKYE